MSCPTARVVMPGLIGHLTLSFRAERSREISKFVSFKGQEAYGLYETATQVVSRRYLVSYHTNSDE